MHRIAMAPEETSHTAETAAMDSIMETRGKTNPGNEFCDNTELDEDRI